MINVHPDFWRQGVGSILFAAAVDGLRTDGYRHGYLWVIAGNQRALQFYNKHGWHPDGATKVDERFGPSFPEVRCSTSLVAANGARDG